MSNVIHAMPNIRFLTDEESREILQKAIIELSSQVDALKAQAESSRLQIETLLTQNAEIKMLRENSVRQNAEIEDLKAKNLETSTKFEKFVNALYKPTKDFKDYKTNTLRILSQTPGENTDSYKMKIYKDSVYNYNNVIITQEKLEGLITDSVKAAGMI